MHHAQREIPARGQLAQGMQQEYGIGAARDRDAHAIAVTKHLVPRDEAGNPIQHYFRQSVRIIRCGRARCNLGRQYSLTMKDMSLNELAAQIRLLLMDVDGTMTDGRVYGLPDAAGNVFETKGFDTQDGIALQWLSWKGLVTGLISGRLSPATVERAKQCNMKYVYQGHIEKIPILEEILKDSGVAPNQV